jgi:hypothetical protein
MSNPGHSRAWPLPPPPLRQPGALVFIGRHCYRVGKTGFLEPLPSDRAPRTLAHCFQPSPHSSAAHWQRAALVVAVSLALITWMLWNG